MNHKESLKHILRYKVGTAILSSTLNGVLAKLQNGVDNSIRSEIFGNTWNNLMDIVHGIVSRKTKELLK